MTGEEIVPYSDEDLLIELAQRLDPTVQGIALFGKHTVVLLGPEPSELALALNMVSSLTEYIERVLSS